MKILRGFSDIPFKATTATIGNFDGVHLGHQKVLKDVVNLAEESKIPSVVISFTKHPSFTLRQGNPVPSICNLDHKIQLIEKMGVDLLILIDFDHKFASFSAQEFLEQLKSLIHPKQLILGYDAVIGKDRQGTREIVSEIGSKLNFEVIYTPPYLYKNQPVSSTWIRQQIMKGDLPLVNELLGRSYSIKGSVKEGIGKGRVLGFATANLALEGLCLPPYGVYAVKLKEENKTYNGVANLGLAPTIQQLSHPILETHILDFNGSLYGKEVEIIFKKHLRPEKVFASQDELQSQIRKDILEARVLLSKEE